MSEDNVGDLRLESLQGTLGQIDLQLTCFERVLSDEEINVSALEARYTSSEKLLSRYLQVYQELIKLSPETHSISQAVEFEKKFYDIMGRAKELLLSVKVSEASHLQDPQGSGSQGTTREGTNESIPRYPSLSQLQQETTNIVPSQSKISHLKAPKLPVFKGDYETWPAFFQMFRTMVHQQPISKILKLHYLRESLSDKAYELVKDTMFKEEHYETALKALKDRYEDKRRILNHYMKRMIDLNSPCTCKVSTRLSAKDIENIFNNVNQTLQALSAMDIDTTTWDPIISYVVTSRFDKYTLAEWGRYAPLKEPPTRKQLLDFLDKQFRVLEAIERQDSKKQDYQTARSQKRKPTSYGFVQVEKKSKLSLKSTSNTDTSVKRCPYCDERHQLWCCATFKKLTLPDKRQVVVSQNLCKLCLRKHFGECRSTYRCTYCKGAHSSLLHDHRNEESKEKSKTSKTSASTSNTI